MKVSLQRLGALIGGGLIAVASSLITMNLNKAGIITLTVGQLLPFIALFICVNALFVPQRFYSFFVFTFTIFSGGQGEEFDFELQRRHVIRFFLAFTHIVSWLGLILTAFFSSVSVSFWIILIVSAVGVLFPITCCDWDEYSIE